jgi:hypothetical protein
MKKKTLVLVATVISLAFLFLAKDWVANDVGQSITSSDSLQDVRTLPDIFSETGDIFSKELFSLGDIGNILGDPTTSDPSHGEIIGGSDSGLRENFTQVGPTVPRTTQFKHEPLPEVVLPWSSTGSGWVSGRGVPVLSPQGITSSAASGGPSALSFAGAGGLSSRISGGGGAPSASGGGGGASASGGGATSSGGAGTASSGASGPGSSSGLIQLSSNPQQPLLIIPTGQAFGEILGSLGTQQPLLIIPTGQAFGQVLLPSDLGGESFDQSGVSITPFGEDLAAQLIAGSPVILSQLVDTPGTPFDFLFDYKFETITGFLDIFLDGVMIDELLAPDPLQQDFETANYLISDSSLLNLTDVLLEFILDGPTGSKVLIDNVVFPGIINGSFGSGLTSWTTSTSTEQGQVGVAALQASPEPATFLLLGSGLAGLGFLRRRKRT